MGTGAGPMGGHPGAVDVIYVAFSDDFTVQLRNSLQASVNAWRSLIQLTDATAGTVDSTQTLYVLKDNVAIAAMILHGNGITLPAGDITTAAITIGTQFLWDDGTNLRLTVRHHYLGPDAMILNPNVLANAGIYFDAGVANGLHRSGTGVAVKGEGVDGLTCKAAAVEALLPLLLPSGNPGAPSLKFSAEAGTTGWSYAAGQWIFSIAGNNLLILGDSTLGIQPFHRVQGVKGADLTASAGVLTMGNANYSRVAAASGSISYITTTGWSQGSRISLLSLGNGTNSWIHNAGSVPANTLPLSIRGGASIPLGGNGMREWILDTVNGFWIGGA